MSGLHYWNNSQATAIKPTRPGMTQSNLPLKISVY